VSLSPFDGFPFFLTLTFFLTQIYADFYDLFFLPEE